MLNILEVCVPKLGVSLAALGPSDPQYWHLMVEAKKLAYSDLLATNGDPKFATVPVEQLLSKAHAATLCGRINPAKAAHAGVRRRHRRRHHLPDHRRSLGQHGVAGPQRVQRLRQPRHRSRPTASCCTTAARAFSLDPKSPNVVAPRKRPFHTIIAGFVMKDGQPLMAFGNMGGSVQPETHAQHMVNLIDLGMNVQMTTDAARFTHNQTSQRAVARAQPVRAGRRGARGARATRCAPSTAAPSAAIRASCSRATRGCPSRSSIARSVTDDLPVNGVYRAGSDHRKDGQAVGW